VGIDACVSASRDDPAAARSVNLSGSTPHSDCS
jgi:hypothetical protein